MPELDYDYNVHTQQGVAESDKHLLVKFYIEPLIDNAKSKEQGRAVYKDVEHISILVPGNRDPIIRKAHPRDIARFPEHYRRFKARIDQEVPLEGTPLSEWPLVTRSLAEEFAFMNIKTVEQLADAPDSAMAKFMGGATFKQDAKDWLARAKGDVDSAKLQRELRARDRKIEQLEKKMEQLLAKTEKAEEEVETD